MSKSSGGVLSKQLPPLEPDKKSMKAILLTENDVFRLREKKIQDWPNLSDVWALKYGLIGLSMSNLLTNTYINSVYRASFLLKSTAGKKFTSSYISSFIMVALFPPAVSASLLHLTHMPRLLKWSPSSGGNANECWMCVEMRALATHLTFGSLIPIAFAWMTSFYHASLYYTIRIPNLESYFKANKKREYLREIGKVFKRTNKNAFGPILACCSFQILLASFVLFMQQKQFLEHIEPYQFTLNEIKRIKN